MAVSLPIHGVLRLETFLRLVLRGILRIVVCVDPQASQQPVTRPANPFLSLLKCPPSLWAWAGKLGPRTREGDSSVRGRRDTDELLGIFLKTRDSSTQEDPML